MTAPREIKELVETFARNLDTYRSGKYNETQVRVEIRAARHSHGVSLVEHNSELGQCVQTAKTTHDRTTLQRQIDATDIEIDLLVYELYGLTDEEIRIVEDTL